MSSLSKQEARRYLAAKDRWIVLSSLGPDGFPHSVPLGYFLVDDRVVMGCKDGTQKIRNIEREARVSLLWENGRGQTELIAVMIRGLARVVRDDAERLVLKQEAARQRGEEIPTSVGDGFVYIEVQPSKTLGWRRPTRRTL
jgi:nitroimidazol reductase NimA-like FMN-containing flavoprotein (pyridoxamine 5'-phosphate oxidase superfamily)